MTRPAPSLAERLDALAEKYGMMYDDLDLMGEAIALARRVADRKTRTLQLRIFADRYGIHQVMLPGPCGGSGAWVEVVILRPDEYWIPQTERVRLVVEEGGSDD